MIHTGLDATESDHMPVPGAAPTPPWHGPLQLSISKERDPVAHHLLNCSTNDHVEVPGLAPRCQDMRPTIVVSVDPDLTAPDTDRWMTS